MKIKVQHIKTMGNNKEKSKKEVHKTKCLHHMIGEISY